VRLDIRPRSLLTRVLAAFAIVALVPVAVLAPSLIRLDREAMTTQVLRTHSVAARATAERIAARLQGIEAIMADIAENPELARKGGPERLLRGLLRRRPEIAAVVLTDPAGETVLGVQRKGLRSVVSTVLRTPPAPVPEVVPAKQGRWIVLSTPLAGDAGWLRLIIDSGWVSRILRPEEIGEEAELAVIGRDGSIQLVSGDQLLELPAGLLAAARGGRTSGASAFPAGGGAILGAWAPVPGTAWTVVSLQPRAIAEAVAVRMRRRAALAVALGLILAAALAGGAYRSVVRPLRRLLATQRKLEGLTERPHTGDELALLEESLSVLARRLADREDLGSVFLGRYQVLGVLGEGSMGTVFRGWDPKLRRPVALKTVRPERSGSERRSNLLDEAAAAAQLVHPNVVAVYDVVERDGVGFIAMELIDGIGLDRLLAVRGTLAPGNVAVLGHAMAEGLAAAHGVGLVHHDVKPGNVLLGFDGSIKLGDFGVARFAGTGDDERSVVYGTPGYIPPEALEGRGYGQVGDLFALGAVLYRCLTGRLPFRGKNLGEMIVRTIEGDPVPVETIRPGVPAELATLVMQLLERDPARRGGNAAVVAERLERLVTLNGWSWDPPERVECAGLEGVTRDRIERSQCVPTGRIPGTGNGVGSSSRTG